MLMLVSTSLVPLLLGDSIKSIYSHEIAFRKLLKINGAIFMQFDTSLI